MERADRRNQERMQDATRRMGGEHFEFDDDSPWTDSTVGRGVLSAVVAFVLLGLCIYGLVMVIASGL
jgi:hypothetical protein